MELSPLEKDQLLNIAHESIINKKLMSNSIDTDEISDNLRTKCGVFVSVYVNNELRGCIGRFKSDKPLYKLVGLMAVQSAYSDTRFDAVKECEYSQLLVEISVISPFKKIQSINEFKLGEHGIYIRKELNSGTFLPQVADKTGWSTEEFLGHCSRDKAGLGWEGWKDAELFVYTAAVFKG